MEPLYDIAQTAKLLSFAANAVSDRSDTQAALQALLETYLTGFFQQMNPQLVGGDWAVVWGPQVYSPRPQVACEAANAMYVAYSASQATYVVAIAATNPESIYDWIWEDGNVNPQYMAPWPLTVPFVSVKHSPPPASEAYISAATALGVSNLLTKLIDPVQGSLQSFLAAQATNAATLIFSGHSLAGALAPTIAFYLYPTLQKQSVWQAVRVQPTAGASPGNSAFASSFAVAYPATPGVEAAYGTWNVDYTNARDVIPHAWNQLSGVVQSRDPAGNYPSFFGVLGHQMGQDLNAAIAAAIKLSTGSTTYQNLPQSVFSPNWGYWNWPNGNYPPTWSPLPQYTDAHPLNTPSELVDVIGATHIDQYMNFFNIYPPPKIPPATPTSGVKAPAPTATPGEPSAEALRKRAILAAAKVS